MMCAVCGCSGSGEVVITDMATGKHAHLGETSSHGPTRPEAQWHSHSSHGPHEHHHHPADAEHGPLHAEALASTRRRTIRLETELLHRNNQLAERNRGWFESL